MTHSVLRLPLFSAAALLVLSGCAWRRDIPAFPPMTVPVLVVVPPSADGAARLAAREIAHSLTALTGKTVATTSGSGPQGAYRINMTPPGDVGPLDLGPGEGAYFLGGTEAWVTGVESDRPETLHGILRAAYALLRDGYGCGWATPGSSPRNCSISSVHGGWARPPRIVRVPRKQSPRVAHVPWPCLTSEEAERLDAGLSATAMTSRTNSFRAWLQRYDIAAGHEGTPRHDVPDKQLAEWSLTLDLGVPSGREEAIQAAANAAVPVQPIPYVIREPLSGWRLGGLPALVLAHAGTGEGCPSVTSLEKLFCAEYGPAATDVQTYFTHWRKLYRPPFGSPAVSPREERLRLAYQKLCSTYSLEDFRKGRAFLQRGLLQELSQDERRRLQKLILAHGHAEMIYLAASALHGLEDHPDDLERALAFSRRLVDLRAHFRTRLDVPLLALLWQEQQAGDVVGTEWQRLFVDTTPVTRLPLKWRVRLDPADRGRNEEWFSAELSDLAEWVEASLSRPPQDLLDAPDKGKRRQIVWLATEFAWDEAFDDAEEIFVNFRGVPHDCMVSINGTTVGTHSFGTRRETGVSFRLVVPKGCLAENEKQWLAVRLEDDGGRTPWLDVAPWLSVREKEDKEGDDQGTPVQAQPSGGQEDSGGVGAPASDPEKGTAE